MLAGLLFAATMGFTACSSDDSGGGGKDLTIEEYFEKLEKASASFTEKGDAAAEDVGDTEDIEKIKDSLSALPPIVADFVDELDSLNPPDDVQDAHDEAVEAGKAFSEEISSVIDNIGDVDSLEALGELIDADAVNKADERFSSACRDLQTIADDANIDVTLDCDEG